MARCIIHAVTHKTGTTTLQSIFSKKRDILKGLNYYYPILDKKGKCHNKLAHHLATCNNQDLLNIRRTLAGCVNSIDDSRDCLFLSAEEFSTRICTPVPWQGFEVAYYDSRRLYLERLLQVLADFEGWIHLFVSENTRNMRILYMQQSYYQDKFNVLFKNLSRGVLLSLITKASFPPLKISAQCM